MKSKHKELDGMYYFNFKIALKDGNGELLKYNLSSASEYEQRVQYFAFEMQKDINLKINNRTIPCALFHFERAYDLAPYSVFLLGFPVENPSAYAEDTKILFEYQDHVFNTGKINFIFKINDLNNIPKIKSI
jgi:hypothetical protein